LIPALINSDAEAFGNQLPGYRAEFASALAELESILKQVDERGP